MTIFDLQQELKFIRAEKNNISDKENRLFQILDIATTILSNYANAETEEMKAFYKTIYQKTKDFYVGREHG